MNINVSEFSAVLGTFTPTRLHISLIEEVKQKLSEGGRMEPLHEAVFVHEHIHFFQTAMTGYGQTTWNIYRQAVSYVVTEWVEITADLTGKRRKLPLGYIAHSCCIKATAKAFLLHNVFKESISLQIVRSSCNCPQGTVDELGLNFLKQPWKINPEIQVAGRPYTLQGKDILECHAKYLEAIYSMILNGQPFNSTLHSALVPEQYWVPYYWFIQELGKEHAHEFPLVCDLALQTVWTDPPKTEEEWQASCPAWRFIKLTETLKYGGFASLESLEEIKHKYKEYANDLLQRCGYIPLEEVISTSLARYGVRQCGTILPLEARMMEPLLFRQQHLWCAANPFLDINVWIEMKNKFVPPLLQIGGELQIVPANGVLPKEGSKEEEALVIENALELHLQALASQIIGSISPYLTDIEHIQCGYGYYGMRKGCAYQKLNGCPGSFRPEDGLPVPLVSRGEEIEGCQFGMVLLAQGINLAEVELDYSNRKMISLEELSSRVPKTQNSPD